MEGRELGRLTAGDVWRTPHGGWRREAIESVLMDLNLDNAEGGEGTREDGGEKRRSDKWTELMG